jgi:hypothetical protein
MEQIMDICTRHWKCCEQYRHNNNYFCLKEIYLMRFKLTGGFKVKSFQGQGKTDPERLKFQAGKVTHL